MGSKRFLAFTCFLALLISAHRSWADEQSGAGPSATPTAAPPALPKSPKHWWSFKAEWNGPSVTNLSAGNEVNPKTGLVDSSWPANIFNELRYSYRIAPTSYVGPLVQYSLYFGLASDWQSDWQYAGARIGNTEIKKTANFKLGAEFDLLWPLAKILRDQNAGLTYQVRLNANYDFSKSRWGLAFTGFESYHTYNGATNVAGSSLASEVVLDYDLYNQIALTRQLNKKTSLLAGYQSYKGREKGASAFSPTSVDGEVMGLNYEVKKDFNLSPSVLFYLGGPKGGTASLAFGLYWGI